MANNEKLNNDTLSSALMSATYSAIGNHKNINEDSIKACPDIGLWLVADGMSGHEGGAIASQFAVNCIESAVSKGVCLVDAIIQAHEGVCQLATSFNGKEGMATTIVAVQIKKTEFEVAWVGDSRAYLFERDTLTQLSHDHTVVQQLIDQGDINEQQARIHPQRNLLRQALGGKTLPQVDSINGQLDKGILLLCTDGLSTELTDDKITSILLQSNDLSWKAENLVNKVLNLEGKDNISVLLIQQVL
ncbi:MAG: serine/threonine-protein phosphatase [Gammaproteobacteria bacterium]|nr:serine/threonine-protein phosphatase [Gammaproteobacteria bacterium]